MSNILIQDVIDIDFLQKFQDSFANSIGVASTIVDSKGNPVTKPSNFTDFCMKYTRGSDEGLKRCMNCDALGGKEPAKTGVLAVYYFHAGLMDFATPIIIDGEQIGSVLGGQVLPKETNKEEFIKIASWIH